MKLIIVTLICFTALEVFGRNTGNLFKEKEREVMLKIMTTCKDEEKGSDDDLAMLMRFEFSETAGSKCMLACGYNKVGIYEDGKFSRENFLYIANMVADNDPVKMQFAAELADKCSAADGERCEQAFQFTKCVHEAATRTHIDMDII